MKEKEEEKEEVVEEVAEAEMEESESVAEEETEEVETEAEETEEEDSEEEAETEAVEEEEEEESEPVEEVKPKKKPESETKKQAKKKVTPQKKETVKKYKKEDDLEEDEHKFTQKDVDRIVKRKLAQALPPKEEMEQYKKWRESQQTIEEKMSVLRVENARLSEENESLLHENMVVKAGVDKDAVDFVLFKVGKMDGDFDENLENYLKKNPRYITPKTVVVEGAEHKKKAQLTITKKELDAMGYPERLKYREEHPEEYAKAMGR